MRLWSIHPKYLDSKGLVALWREALLAKKVLEGKTIGYRNHPQLERFRKSNNPLFSINHYLEEILIEATKRGYNFDSSKINKQKNKTLIPVTQGQLLHELEHLRNKLEIRDKNKLKEIKSIKDPETHSLFEVISGKKESWEKI